MFVITATDGLCLPDGAVSRRDLARFALGRIDEGEPGFTKPLMADVRRLSRARGGARFVLLGSVATEKYVTPLTDVLGQRLVFPEAFVGMGDMSRGSVLLTRAESGRELAYRTVNAGPRRGPRRTMHATASLLLLAALVGCDAPAEAPSAEADDAPAVLSGGSGLDGRVSAPSVASAPIQVPDGAIPDSMFGRLVRELSEPGGYFDTDNLISNERSYLHVAEALETEQVRGGAYIGVGPDQNFSYMAIIEPELAFIVDIRRDNQLQHLWFKALFEAAGNRVEYLSMMFGRPWPEDASAWSAASLEDVIAWVDGQPLDPAHFERSWRDLRRIIDDLGLGLSDDDYATIRSIHEQFARAGLGLRFTSHNRAPRPYYPTYRDLLLETDLSGAHASYLVDEDRFQALRELQRANRVVPVVGNLAGAHALRAIADHIRRAGLVVSGFYTSNVEFYLMGNRSFPAFAANVAALPIDDRSVLIRSYFDRFRAPHPEAVSGYASVQLLHSMDDFVRVGEREGFAGYWDLVTREAAVRN